MSERLTFNLRGSGRELRDRIAWVAAPATGSLQEAAAPYLPPIERPNWGFWGVFFAIPIATVIHAVLRAWPRAGREPGRNDDRDRDHSAA